MSETVIVNAKEHQQQRELLKLLDQVWNDPNVGEQVRRRAKELKPEIAIPDDHPVATKMRGELESERAARVALETAFNDYKARGETERAEVALRSKLGEVQGKYRLTDEGMAKTIEIMQQRQLADPEAAALLYRESIPKAPPTRATNPIFDTRANLFGVGTVDEKWAKLHTDPDGFFADVVNEVFTEMPPGI